MENSLTRPLDRLVEAKAVYPSAPSLKDVGKLQVEVAPAGARVLGISSALPGRRYTQQEMLDIFGYTGYPFAEAIFERSTIKSRPMVLAPEDFERNIDPYFQFERSQSGCLDMAEMAIRQALSAAGASIEDIGCIALATTSQLHMPSLTALLVERMNLPRGVVQYNLLGHGCAGAVPLLTLAEGHLRRYPDHLVVAVCVEVGSVMLQLAPLDNKAAVVANSLFSDAGVALVLGGRERARAGSGRPIEFVDAMTLQGGADCADSALYVMQPNGCRTSLLHKELPERSAGIIVPAIDAMLERNGLTRADVRHWAMHPGGRAILDKLQGVLALSDEQMAPSREVLRTTGNASSPTCLIVLESIAARPGDWGVVVCIGPGLIAACALVRWAL